MSRAECRRAFFAGAAILFKSMMLPGTLDAGTEPTDRDLEVMADLQAELDEFGHQLDSWAFNPSGRQS